MSNKSLCEGSSSDMDEIINLLEQRDDIQQNILQHQQFNSIQINVEDPQGQIESSEQLKELQYLKNKLEQKIFSELSKVSKFQNYFQDGYSTQFRQCMEYFQYQKMSVHQKLFASDSYSDYFYIILKGKIGLFSSQQLFHEQAGYQYQGKTLTQITRLGKQSYQENSNEIGNKNDSPQKQKVGDINQKVKNNNTNIEGYYYLLKVASQGMPLGEISLLMEQSRTFSAIALEDQTILLKLNCQKFQQILKIREESKLFANLGCIKECSSINFLSFNALKDIFTKSYSVKFQRDQYVCLQKQYPKAAFLIQSGEFSLWSYTNLNSNKAPPSTEPYQTTLPKYHIKQEIKMSLLGIKEIFGDIEILSGQRYQYSLKCESDGDILIIPREVYEAKVKQNELLIDIIKNKSSNINQKRVQLYKKFNQNLEVYRHFMYDADDTDEEDSGKIGYNKGYDVFLKSKFFKRMKNSENQQKGSKKNNKNEEIQFKDQLSSKAEKNQMKELLFLENVNCYDLNNQDKHNFYFTYKGSSNQLGSQNSTINNEQSLLQNSKNENVKRSKKSVDLLFQTNFPIYLENKIDSTKNDYASQQNKNLISRNSLISQQQQQQQSICDQSLQNLKNSLYRNRSQRNSSRNQESRTRQGSLSIQNENYKEIVQFCKSNAHYQRDYGVKGAEDSNNCSPTNSIGWNRQMEEEIIISPSQRISKSDLDSLNKRLEKLSSKDQRRIIRKLQKQNKDLFKMKIDPKLKQKLIGYEKNQNFIEDYREQNLQIQRNSLHANHILKQLNYQPEQIKEFIKINQFENDERQQNANIFKINFQFPKNPSKTKNKSMPHTPLSNTQNNAAHLKNIQKYRPSSYMQQQNLLQEAQFLIARIDDSSVQTPLTAPSSKQGVQNKESPRKNQNKQIQLLVKQKPKTANPISQRAVINQVQQNKFCSNRESNSSFTSHHTAYSELDGFNKSQQSYEQNGYDINQYRQERIKSQSFSLNIMNSMEAGFRQVNTPTSLHSNRDIQNNVDNNILVQRRQTFNCITNTVNENKQPGQQQQQLQQQQQQQMIPSRPPTGRQKVTTKEGRCQNSYNNNNQNSQISKISLNNQIEDRKELIPEALVGNQIQLQKKQNRNSQKLEQFVGISEENKDYNQIQKKNILQVDHKNHSISGVNKQLNIEDNQKNKIQNKIVSQSFQIFTKPNITYQKQNQINSRDNSQEQQTQIEQQQKSINQRRYISFDFRPPAFVKHQY